LFTVARKELTQVFAAEAESQIPAEQPFERLRHLARFAAVPDWPRDSLVLANRAANDEVVGVDEAAFRLDLLAFETDIGDPVLAATVGAAGDVQLELLIEFRQPVLEFFHKPAR